MKKIFFFLIISFSIACLANEAEQEDGFPGERRPTIRQPTTYTSIGVATIQWNEVLRLQQQINMTNDYANYSGLAISLQKEKNYPLWGWSMGVFAGSGRAVGGGNSTVVEYKKGQVDFIIYGASPRIFYRLSERANLGASTMVFMKNIEWPKDNNIKVDSGRNINIATLADLNLRLLQKWDLQTGIGPLAEGSTFWTIELKYRF